MQQNGQVTKFEWTSYLLSARLSSIFKFPTQDIASLRSDCVGPSIKFEHLPVV